MEIYSVILFYSLASAVSGNITPNKTELFAEEGSNVTLSCSYSSADYLFWYRQYPGSAPEFLVLLYDGTTTTETSDVDPRLSVKLTKWEQTHVYLEISSAAVSDSALYYCALRPTVTGNTSDLYKNLQYPNKEPQYLLHKFARSQSAADTSDDRFQSTTSGTSTELTITDSFSTKTRKEKQDTKEINRVDLEISSAAVSDSALYYCALRPTVTGNTVTLYKNLTQLKMYK
ncbi:uncharacterized protein LOC127499181 [Ctenopharyngodon idella]|uniref:uncharacterized protein LOC127499181 n=1 Tax=Ctenopharyngodon idella TaxID=7959 RepID=UPI0022319626|nr:uncharacterized protein LOC127499181 [Ctenopharyngodon idella]